MSTKNPMFSNLESGEALYDEANQATYAGISIKTSIFLIMTFFFGGLTYYFIPQLTDISGFIITLVVSSIVGFIAVLIGRYNENAAKYAGTIYAACEGLFLGALTLVLNLVVPGVGIIAVLGTAIIFAIMLLLYSIKAIRVTSTFSKFCFAFTLGAILIILMYYIAGTFIPELYENLPIFIGISAFLLIYGAITLILNFEEAKQTVEYGLPKVSEWRVSLGLLVSIIYIYIQLIRILAVIMANYKK